MASLVRGRNGNYSVSFRWAKKQHTRSLKTTDAKQAEAGRLRVEATLTAILQGFVIMPSDADHGEFLLSGGVRDSKPKPNLAPLTLDELFAKWKETAKHRANTMRTKTIHQGHALRLLGKKKAVDAISVSDLQRYADKRSGESGNNGKIRPYTVRKELRTLRQTIAWGKKHGLCDSAEWQPADVELAPDPGREPFRTYAEIADMIRRGKLSAPQQKGLWACLYLTSEEVKEVLEYVRENAVARWVYPLFVFCALTGARRAELLRSQVDDWELERGIVHIRELKRDKRVQFTMRTVHLHSLAVSVMKEWFATHPGGQWAIAQENGNTVSGDLADGHFDRVLGCHAKWKRIRGFHVFRHSFASILASNGEDQRQIDALMGHQTDEMRKRYQHLLPQTKRRAIDSLIT